MLKSAFNSKTPPKRKRSMRKKVLPLIPQKVTGEREFSRASHLSRKKSLTRDYEEVKLPRKRRIVNRQSKCRPRGRRRQLPKPNR